MLRLLPLLSSSKQLVPLLLHSKPLHSPPPLSNMDLKSIVSKLEEIAPSKFAESWDNVGLLVEPKQTELISRVLLTNDLTEQVMEDAVNLPGDKIGLIISYHPPIFRPMKIITQNSAKERILLRAIQAGIAVYSPHTALDPEINDWLLSGLGEGRISSLGVGKTPSKLGNLVQLRDASAEGVRDVCDSLNSGGNISVTVNSDQKSGTSVLCSDRVLADLFTTLKDQFPTSEISIKANQQYDVHLRGGKKLILSDPLPLSQLVAKVKQHLQLSHVRLATPPRPNQQGDDPVIKSVSVCAGSGGSVLSGVASDLYLTGEMGHHDVLEACSRGTSVILCEHSNTERGYLHKVYKKHIEAVLGERVEVVIAHNDRDPLQIV